MRKISLKATIRRMFLVSGLSNNLFVVKDAPAKDESEELFGRKSGALK
jgi:hypothetical protein